MVRVAINGFGRIGRMVLKAGLRMKGLKFVAVNDLCPIENLVYLLKYDSVYGIYHEKIKVKKNFIKVGGHKIRVFSEKEPASLPWKKLKVDVVAECTGRFTEVGEARKHLWGGARKVLISAPAKGDCKFIVRGVNEKIYDKKKDELISNGSCTTNCLAPIAKVLNDNLGIRRGFLTTVHAYTATQNLVDGPNKKLRRGRAAAWNIVPTTTGAAESVVKVIPALKGRMDGIAVRVPVLCGSVVDFVCEVKRRTSIEGVNKLFERAARKEMRGIIQYSEEELVSSDILGNPHSAIFDAGLTNVKGNLVKVLAWYDNEWGFSCRMVEVMKGMI